MRARIALEGMSFYAFHGVHPTEREKGNKFKVELSFEADITKAAETDDLAETVNYEDVYELVKQEMAIPSQLLEHIGARILTVIKQNYPTISSIELKISKKKPPVSGKVDHTSVTLTA